MKVIAFVDDEQGILDGLRRTLRSHRKEWDMHFYLSGDTLLSELQEKKFDIIISDMRMPQMNGVQLLETVIDLSPHTLRFVLSGYANDEMILESLHTTHQFISKPAGEDKITKTIERAILLQNSLNDGYVKSIVGSIESLPTLPAIYDELMKEISSDDTSIQRIGKIISQDLGLSSSLLKMVNSAFFGLVRHIESTEQAVSILGVESIKNIVLSTTVFSSFSASKNDLKEIETLNNFSQKVGILAGKIATHSCLINRAKDHAQMAGMMTNLGAFIAIAFADQIDKTNDDSRNFPLLGSYLLGIWAIPFPVVEAVRWYQQPALSNVGEISPLAIVHAAWAMLTLYMEEQEINFESDILDIDYLDATVGRETVNEWKEIVEDFYKEVNSDND